MKQGYNSRLDESLGMRNGKESSKSQDYKSRRDESRGMAASNNDKYMPKGMDKTIKSTDKRTMSVNVPCGEGFSQVKPFKQGDLGYPKQAFDYKY